MIEDDGDFERERPEPPEVEAQAQLLESMKSELQTRLEGALAKKYGDLAGISPLRFGRVRRGAAWADFGVTGPDGTWLWIGIRNLWTHAPRAWIDYYTFDDWQARRALKDAHQRIKRAGFTPRNGYFRFERPIEDLAGASPESHDAAVEVFARQLDKLVRSGAFDVEIRRLQPKLARRS